MKTIKKVMVVFLLVIMLAFCISVNSKVFADDKITPGAYKTTINYGQSAEFFKKVTNILSVIRGISIIVALISITIVGIKYVVGSVEEKAQYKEKLIPIAIGAILIAGISTFLKAIEDIMN